ncbi:high mobility group nucleosome-binding domain-containing protein 3-like [Xyrauchen texanus]|uniref:high mobility group nucleosome-binding domain-containing protein 3-like n=1 Tax=Xyrauchen texanus TaxID=154827 RepID=UPI00224259A6|nr:high mobility group nucleosome-binding domain-containing protein 3-like [Xyrauchen texanus]
MPKRKSPEGAEAKSTTKVTKQEPTRRSERLSSKPAPKPEPKAKKPAAKKPSNDKAVKENKGGAKGKKVEKESAPTANGETKPDEETETSKTEAESK